MVWQLQWILTTTHYKKRPCRFGQLLRMFVILVELLTRLIEWQSAVSLQENASDSKALTMTTP